MNEPQPDRVRVTSPYTDRPRVRPRRTAASEIDAQSPLGEIYLRALLRSQLRLAARTMLVLAATIGLLPAVFFFVPALTTRQLLGMPVAWVLLAFGCYPVLVLIAWRHTRAAERHEEAFAQVVEGS